MDHSHASIDVEIGKALRAARDEQRYTIAQLALRADVPTATIEAIEQGAERASAAQLFRLSRVLGVELRSLFSECCSMQYSNPSSMLQKLRTDRTLSALVEKVRLDRSDRYVA